MSFKRINEFIAQENKKDDLFQFLKSIVIYIKKSDGCVSCELLRSETNLSKFIVLEEWISKEDHKASIDNFPKEKMMSAMSLFATPPKGEFFIYEP